MKKIAVFIVILSVLIIGFSSVSADSGLRNAKVTISSTPDTVKVGETVILTAVTEKHGSSFSDNWNNAVKGNTIFDSDTGTYISTAVFTALKPGIYVITYNIDMSAGKSSVDFNGKAERTIKVVSSSAIAGADIRNLVITPVYDSNGNIYVYRASGIVYTLWNDQPATPDCSIFFNFGPNETEKNVSVTLVNNGSKLDYMITVQR